MTPIDRLSDLQVKREYSVEIFAQNANLACNRLIAELKIITHTRRNNPMKPRYRWAYMRQHV